MPRINFHQQLAALKDKLLAMAALSQQALEFSVEAYLARELGMHYAGIALITDYDTGVEDDAGVAPVSQEQVFAFFEENLHHVRALLHDLIPRLPVDIAGCTCAQALGPLHAFD